mgnify:CR=1 FL=1
MPTLLVVEDYGSLQVALQRIIALQGLEGLSALTIEEAQEHLANSFGDIDGILMDGMNGGGLRLVKELHAAKFPGIIIACSTSKEMNEAMVREGANAAITGINKDEGIDLFLDLFEKSNQERML